MLQRQTTLRLRTLLCGTCIIIGFPIGIYGLPFLGMHEDAALAIGAGYGCMGGLMMTVADMDLDVMAFESGFAGSVVGYGMPSVFGGWSACYCFWYSGQAGSGGRPAFALAPIPMLVSLWVA